MNMDEEQSEGQNAAEEVGEFEEPLQKYYDFLQGKSEQICKKQSNTIISY